MTAPRTYPKKPSLPPAAFACKSVAVAVVMGMGLAITLGSLAGCQYFMIASVLMRGPQKTPAAFKLPDKRTLVLIDDPDQVMNAPALEGVIQANVAFHINQNIGPDSKAKEKDRFTAGFVPLRDLATLRGRLGDAYMTTPIDRIGQEVGAGQVIYVRLVSFTIPMSMGLEPPRCICRVKVIDAQSGRRLFPAPDLVGDTANHIGHQVDTQLTHKSYDRNQPNINRTIRRDLAQQTGRNIARLFYKWAGPGPGDRLPG